MIGDLLEQFSTLSISNNTHLFAFADTEGMSYRSDLNSSLWDFNIIFKYVITDDFEIKDDIFHVTHLSIPKHSEKKDVTPVLQTHVNTLNFLKDYYKAENIFLCFWNAHHDNRVLKTYIDHKFVMLDLLKWARIIPKKYKGKMSIGALSSYFGITSKNKLHTSLGDTHRMIQVVNRLEPSPDKFMKSIKNNYRHISIEYKDKPKANTKKKNEAKTSSPIKACQKTNDYLLLMPRTTTSTTTPRFTNRNNSKDKSFRSKIRPTSDYYGGTLSAKCIAKARDATNSARNSKRILNTEKQPK